MKLIQDGSLPLRRSAFRFGFLALLSGLVATLLLGWVTQRSWPLTLAIGGQDARFVAGFHGAELSDGLPFRWTSAHSELALPRPPLGPALLTMRLENGYASAVPPPQLRLSVAERLIGTFSLARREDSVRSYRLLLPADRGLGWALPLVIDSSTYTPPGDRRTLGAVLYEVTLAPSLLATPFPAAPVLLSAFALGALLCVALTLAGLRQAYALALTLAVVALLSVALLLHPLEVLPFLQRLAAIPVIACAVLLFVRLVVPLQRGTNQSARIDGAYLPTLLAIIWWALPMFQAVQLWDGAQVGVGDDIFVQGLLTGGLLVCASLGSRFLPSEQRRTALARIAGGGLALGAAFYSFNAIIYAFTRTGKDFWILFKGTREWMRGSPLYDLTAVMTNHVGAVFKVPPFYAMLFMPFVFQDGLQVLFYHRLLNVGLMLATALIWLRIVQIKPVWWGLATVLILFNSRPLSDTIAFGQIDLLLLFLLTCALWALRHERDWLAGALIALGTLFKIYPVILLAFFVVKRRWYGLLGFALAMLLCNGLAIAVMGWEVHRTYLFDVLPRIGGTTSWIENQTISGFLARLADTPFEAHLFTQRPLALSGLALSALLSLGACLIALRPAPSTSTTFALQYAQFLLLMVLAVPAAWMHYETLLVLVFGLLLWHLRERDVPLLVATMLALSFALISYGNQWSFNSTTSMGLLTIAGVSYKCYGMLVLAVLLAHSLLQAKRSEAVPV